MTPRYRTAFSVPSGFAATTPAAEIPAQKPAGKVRSKVAAATRSQSSTQRGENASDQLGSAAA